MVAIVSDELVEKIEADALIKFHMVVQDVVHLYKNFNELTLLEKDSSKVVLLSVSVFVICNQLPFDITLITGYPGEETFFWTKSAAYVKEIKWDDYKRNERDRNNDDENAETPDLVLEP